MNGASQNQHGAQAELINFKRDTDEPSRNIMLNADCLEEIFRYLPVKDLFRVQRVCKLWQYVSLHLLRYKAKKIQTSTKFWGVSPNFNIKVDLKDLQQLLRLSGSNPQSIDLTCREPDCEGWVCPGPHTEKMLTLVSEAFTELRSFRTKSHMKSEIADPKQSVILGKILHDNPHLKRIEFQDISLEPEVLAEINPDVEELILVNCNIMCYETLTTVVANATNLRVFKMHNNSYPKHSWEYDSLLRALSNHRKLECLHCDLLEDNNIVEVIPCEMLTLLKKLHLGGYDIVYDNNLEAILGCCQQLEELHICESHRLTDSGLKKLAKLPNLKSLALFRLTELTDMALRSMINIPKVTIIKCQGFTTLGLENFIEKSTSTSLEIFGCENVSPQRLFEKVKSNKNKTLELGWIPPDPLYRSPLSVFEYLSPSF